MLMLYPACSLVIEHKIMERQVSSAGQKSITMRRANVTGWGVNMTFEYTKMCNEISSEGLATLAVSRNNLLALA